MGFCDFPLADKLCAVGDAVDFASDPGKAIGDWMAKSAGELAAAAADLAAEAVNTTTKVDLNATWFVDNYEMLLPLGLVLLVATFCAQLVRAAIRRDGQALTQAFTGTMSGVLFAFCAIAFTTVAVEVVDAVSDGLFKTAHLNIESAVRRIVKVNQIGGLAYLGWLVPVVAGLGAAIGAFLYWCVMMVRKVGILVMVTLAVFASAAWRLGGRPALAQGLDRSHRHPGGLEAADDRDFRARHRRHGQDRGQGRHRRAGRRHVRHRDHDPGAAVPVRGLQVRALGSRRHRRGVDPPCWRRRCADREGSCREGRTQGRRSCGHRRNRWRRCWSGRRTAGPRRRRGIPWRHRRQSDRRRRRRQGRLAERRNRCLARRRRGQVRPGEGRSACADERVRRHQRSGGRQPGSRRIRPECRVRAERRMAVHPADHDPAAAGRTAVLRYAERRFQRGERIPAAASDRPLIP